MVDMDEAVEPLALLADASGGVPAVAVGEAGAAVVDARKLAGQGIEPVAAKASGGRIQGPAAQPGHRPLRIGAAAVGAREERRLLILHDVRADQAAFLPAVHDVEDVAGLDLDPAYRGRRIVAPQDADERPLFRLPGISRPPRPRPL